MNEVNYKCIWNIWITQLKNIWDECSNKYTILNNIFSDKDKNIYKYSPLRVLTNYYRIKI